MIVTEVRLWSISSSAIRFLSPMEKAGEAAKLSLLETVGLLETSLAPLRLWSSQ